MKHKEIFSWVKSIIIACILAFVVREYILAPIVVDGESMMPTLKNDEHIILNEVGKNKASNIKRFDIIVFHATKEKDYIKRVIGLPGDHIEYRNDTLYVNGKKYEEPYLDQYKKEMVTGPLTEDFKLEEFTGSKTVPEGQLFVMGDNRKYSLDSRSPKVGTISVDKIVGKAKLAYWPLKEVQWIK
ncbi:signal peptidase I [Priestia aryabhattai]|uniref:signal peptidase I n=1 Tax=Priestia aryabhattai TaxID=412384 RepID=UPI001FB3F95D|nr:signal peptidase I [Priestia aryabhattai]